MTRSQEDWSNLRSQAGIGLVEILIAMVLFAIGISMAMRTLPESNVATTRARNITTATNLAQKKIEELMAIPFSSSDLDAGNHTDPDNPINRHFRRTWTVADDSPMRGMKMVSVSVSFETASKDSSVTLSMFLTSRR